MLQNSNAIYAAAFYAVLFWSNINLLGVFLNGRKNVAAYASIGALGLFTLVKGISVALRGGMEIVKMTRLISLLEISLKYLKKKTKVLRDDNARLRDDWQKLAREEAVLSARIQGLESQVKEQNRKNKSSFKIDCASS